MTTLFFFAGRGEPAVRDGSDEPAQFGQVGGLCGHRQLGNQSHQGSQVHGETDVIWSGKEEKYMRSSEGRRAELSSDAEYVHICSNETIGGIRYPAFPRPKRRSSRTCPAR